MNGVISIAFLVFALVARATTGVGVFPPGR
jgi:hypothetical protein